MIELKSKIEISGVNAAVTFDFKDEIAERPWTGLQRVAEVFALKSTAGD